MSDTHAPSAPTAGVDFVTDLRAMCLEVVRWMNSPAGIEVRNQVRAVTEVTALWINQNRSWLLPLAIAAQQAEEQRIAAEQEDQRAAAEEAAWSAVRASGPPIDVVDDADSAPSRGRGGFKN